MKKFFALLLVLALLVALSVPVWAAGRAAVTGPEVVRAGDTITVSFYAGGGIYGGSGSVSYDSSLLSLQGYTAAIGGSWAVEFNGNSFVFYDNSMANPLEKTAVIFKATFKVSGSAAAGSQLTVSVNSIVLSDGTSDSGIGTKSYSVTVAPPLSGNANLASLTLGNAELSPAFSAGNTNYTASVPYTTSSLQVSATAEHGGAQVAVSNTNLKAGGTTDVTVTVTAENGATQVYHIKTKRAQDPNYVKSTVNSLSALTLEEFRLSPVFEPERLHYAVWLPNEVEALNLSAELTDNKGEVTLPELTAIPVGETTYEIPVTAENGDVRTYTLTVFRAAYFDPTAEPTVPETEPETEPVTEATTEATTEETTESTTEPATVPTTEPAPLEDEPKQGSFGIDFWLWILIVIMAFCAGAITILLIPQARRSK